jgi:hypothetical protein
MSNQPESSLEEKYEKAPKVKPKPKKLKATLMFNGLKTREVLYTQLSKDFTTGFLFFHGVDEKVLINPESVLSIDVEEVAEQ